MDKVRRLSPEVWIVWRDFRLHALKEAPEAFGSSFEEEAAFTEETWRSILSEAWVVGYFEENQMISGLALSSHRSKKTQHRALLLGMFTKKAYQGQGYGEECFTRLLAICPATIDQLECECLESNKKALKFYQKLGFQIIGRIPAALKQGGRSLDGVLLFRRKKV